MKQNKTKNPKHKKQILAFSSLGEETEVGEIKRLHHRANNFCTRAKYHMNLDVSTLITSSMCVWLVLVRN
jgi:hypothetical protein